VNKKIYLSYADNQFDKAMEIVKLLEKDEDPVPSIVLVVNAIVGLAEVLQQTPFCTILWPLSDVMLPPEVAEKKEMLEKGF
jgi:hypothetical protein